MPQFPRVQSRHLPKLRGIRFGTDGDTGFFAFSPRRKLIVEEGEFGCLHPKIWGFLGSSAISTRGEHHQPGNEGLPGFLQMGKTEFPCLCTSGHIPPLGLP